MRRMTFDDSINSQNDDLDNLSKLTDCYQSHQRRNFDERSSLLRITRNRCETASSTYFHSTMENLSISMVNNVVLPDVNSTGIGWLSVAFGLANATMGVGALTFPLMYDKLGGVYYATLVQLVTVAILLISICILVYSSELTNSDNYQEILAKFFGRRAEIVVAIDIFLATFGACVAYLLVIGDQFDRIFASFYGETFCGIWFMNRRFTIILVALLISPLCFLRHLHFMRHTAPLGMISMLYVVFLTIYQHFTLPELNPGPIKTQSDNAIVFIAAIPVICFSYQANEVVVPIYTSMKTKSFKSFFQAAFFAYAILIFLFCLIGYFGYISFGSNVSSDIMIMFNAKDPIVLIGVMALITKMALTFPQMIFVNRGTVDCLYVTAFNLDFEKVESGKDKRRYIQSVILFTTMLTIAVFVSDISIVIESLGALSAINVFIIPAICLIHIATHYKQRRFIKVLYFSFSYLMIAIGFGLMALVIYKVRIDISNPTNHNLCKI